AERPAASTASTKSQSFTPLRFGRRVWRKRRRRFRSPRSLRERRTALRLPGTTMEFGMPRYTKKDFHVWNVRRFLEPAPIVLVSSAHRNETNIMTMGWHMVMEFSPALVACLISGGNHSFDLVRSSRQCVINIPTVDIAEAVVRIGNTSGREVDKFSEFG